MNGGGCLKDFFINLAEMLSAPGIVGRVFEMATLSSEKKKARPGLSRHH